MLRFNFLASVMVLMILLMPQTAISAVAGHVQFVSGDVTVVGVDGVARAIKKGDEIFPGETIQTGILSNAQLRMVDNGFLSIRQRSSLRIDEYRYQGSKNDRSFFSLLKGNFRALTGMITKYNRNTWKTRTETAVLGVRGSDADIGFNQDSKLTAVRTFTGGYTLTPNDKSMPPLDVDAGGIGVFVPGAPPTMATSFPFEPPAPEPQPDQQSAKSDDGPVTATTEDAPLPPPPTEVAGVAPPPADSGGGTPTTQTTATMLPSLPAQLPVSSGTTVLSAQAATATSVPAKIGSGGTGSYVLLDTFFNPPSPWANNGSIVFDGTPQKSGTIDVNGQLLTVNDIGIDGSFKFSSGTATHVAGGAFSIPALGSTVIYKGNWGVWSGGYSLIDFGIGQTTVGNFYYAWGEKITTTAQLGALNGTRFTFNMIGGAAGNETGVMANNFSVTASGTFGAAPTLGTVAISGSANFPSGSTGWTFSSTTAPPAAIADLINGNVGVQMSASCTGCSVSPSPPSGVAHGQFVGNQAEGLVMSISANDWAGKAMVGSAALKR